MSKKTIEDIYPLTPLQEGLLYHAVLAPKDGAYHDQFSAMLRGPLEADRLVQAWRTVAAGHAIFRTAFAWKTGKAPLQVVGRTAETPVRTEDWRDANEAARRERRVALIAADARDGFDPGKAPLTRLTLVRWADDAWFLLWSRHHLLLDGWSVAHVMREWLEAYHALVQGQPVAPTTARPFRDYLGWLKRQDESKAEAFWRAELGDLVQPTTLGWVHPPDATLPEDAERHGERELRLSAAESATLRSFAREAQVTLATVFQGAWALMLARLGGDRDVVFGHTVSGRPADLPRADSMVGLFINTLPLRAKIESARPVGEWLRALQDRVMATREFEHTPLVKIQGWTEVPRDRSLFETLLVFENYPIDEALEGALGPLRVEEAHSHERTHYPATMIVAPGKEITLLMLHDRSRLPDELAERWLRYFRTLLGCLSAAADEALGNVHGLHDDEHTKLMAWGHDTGLAHDRTVTLSGLWSDQVARTPEAVALIDGEQRLTYAEVSASVGAVGGQLRKAGVGPEDRVGVCLERGANLVVALLGAMQAGATYVPLDPTYPAERLKFMFEDAGLVAVVAQRSTASLLPEHNLPTVGMEELALGGEATGAEASPAVPSNLAYLIYTSGSTGRPKATAIEHRQAVALVHWAQATFGAEELAGVLFSTSVCFDLSVFELFVTLSSGGKVIVAENALALSTLAARDEVTLLNTVPSAAAELARQGDLPAGLRSINLAGEPLTAALADQLYAFPGVERVRDLYGPSEDTTYSTWTQRVPGRPATIGRVIANSRLYLVDEDLQLVPAGAIGEIVLAGEGVARGYLGRPDLTAERFVPDPFTPEPGGRLYRTGDLACYGSDGQLRYLGRRDHQVKIRGFRVELGEIQARLEAHPEIVEAAVLAREHAQRGTYLVAFVVCSKAATVVAETLADWVKVVVPTHMAPTVWHVLPALPRTANGKLDRRALPEDGDDDSAASAGENGDARLSQREEILAGIWADVLGRSRVGPEDNFFDLGGHSLLATQVIARTRKALGGEVGLRVLFDHPTVREFAGAVGGMDSESSDSSDTPTPRESDAEVPLSPAQERMWVLARLGEMGATYHLPTVLEARGALDGEALEQALQMLGARHESLRTVFPAREGRAFAEVKPSLAVPVRRGDVGTEEEARRLAAEEAEVPFDLIHGPFWRAAIWRLGPDRHWLQLTVHHLVTDGWSEAVLVRELAQLYAGEKLTPLSLGYGDYARWQRTRVSVGVVARQVAAWADDLRDVPALELPLDRARPAVPTYRGGLVEMRVAAETATGVRGLARKEGATLFMVMLAAWEVWLWRHSGQTDFAVGTPVAGRNRPEWESQIGLFVNTLVVRSDVRPETTVGELVRAVRARMLSAHDRAEAPFEQVVEAVKPARDVSRSPLFQVMFSVQNTPKAELRLAGLELVPVETEVTTAKFELSMTVAEAADGGLRIGLEYNRDLFDQATAVGFLRRYETLVAGMFAAPKAEVATLAWVPEIEAAKVTQWSQGEPVKTGVEWVPEVIADQIVRTPDARAVTQGNESWSYARLETESKAMGARLRAAGIGHGDTVAVLADREPALVAALLGVWRVGAAYVPLDPEYPPDRWGKIVSENGLDAVLLPGAWRSRWPAEETTRLIAWDEPVVEIDAAPVERSAASVAYVLFTSGSTGRPKGVAISHGALAQHLDGFNAAQGFGPDDVILQKTPFTFDASVWEFWCPLMTGGRLELAEPGAQRDPAALVATMAATGVTVLQAVPTLWERLVEEPGLSELTALRRMYSGGEVLTAKLRDRLAGVRPVPLVNLYGPTETTIQCAMELADAEGRIESEDVPLGRPVAGCALYVLNESLQPVAPGVVGELYVGGGQVARGYWGQPELTAERFLPDPWAPTPGGRMYATGDHVSWDSSGILHYAGRTDDQVKLRGFRIELGEVEAALAALPGVAKASALVRSGQLVGYVEWSDAPEDWHETVRRVLGSRLAPYMVPARLTRMETWPLLSSGKVNRAALPEPDATTAERRVGSVVPPVGATETALAALWQELLRVPEVGRQDNFFALGGDSIIALQVAARAGGEGLRVPGQAVFAHQTLAELAAVVETTPEEPAIKRQVDGPPIITPAQAWFFGLNLAVPGHWNQSALVVTPVDFDVGRFEAAWAQVVARHDVLRWRYENGRMEPTETSVSCVVKPLGELATVVAETQAGLDLAAGPLVRAVVFAAEGESEGRLLLVAHHLVIDGVSWRVLLDELSTAYAGDALSEAAPTWEPWTHALAAAANAPETQSELAYWRGLAAAEPLPRDEVAPGRGCGRDEAVIERVLPGTETATLLQEAGKAYRTQINDLLLAALARALKEWTGRDGQTIMMEGHGREDLAGAPDVSRTLGWFTALFPVHLTATEEPGELIKTVKEQARAVPRRGLGYGLLRYLGSAEAQAELGGRAEPEFAFNYLGQVDAAAGAGGFRAAPETRGADRAPENARPFLVELNAAVAGGELRCAWSYSQAHHTAATIERLATGFEGALRVIIAHCAEGSSGGFTASDFSAEGVSQTDLDKLFSRLQ
jgi:amino acid adenylation domain-containing protein/non-ribosomal peptide synthase protein (TIGR01720 family)